MSQKHRRDDEGPRIHHVDEKDEFEKYPNRILEQLDDELYDEDELWDEDDIWDEDNEY